MKKMNIVSLRKRHKVADKKARDLRQKIEDAEEKLALPKLRKKYEGKFFVYDNGFNQDERWPLYVHCRKVTDQRYGMMDQFESQPINGNGNIFKVNEEISYSHCQKEISQKEYEEAFWTFFENILKMQVGDRSMTQVFTDKMKQELGSLMSCR